jgi:hypothetical protein
MAAKDKFGPGFDKEELASPLYIGPSKGQEGWTPANPEVPFVRDPMGYLPEEGGRERK